MAMSIPNEQLERIWTQIYSGTPYPGWRADRTVTIDVLSRTAPESAWTRVPPDGVWENAPTPVEAANT
jgi:hypothetical protein